MHETKKYLTKPKGANSLDAECQNFKLTDQCTNKIKFNLPVSLGSNNTFYFCLEVRLSRSWLLVCWDFLQHPFLTTVFDANLISLYIVACKSGRIIRRILFFS